MHRSNPPADFSNPVLHSGSRRRSLTRGGGMQNEHPDTRVILIGALFRANRFRANPTNLYGADEYIEEQIPEKEFKQIIRRLFPQVGVTGGVAATDRPERAGGVRVGLDDAALEVNRRFLLIELPKLVVLVGSRRAIRRVP